MPFALHPRDNERGGLEKRCNAKGIARYGLLEQGQEWALVALACLSTPYDCWRLGINTSR
jgi:hypothetical protein